MSYPVVVTAATETVVSLAEAKEHLRVDITDDDVLINNIIGAATRFCEGVSWKSFVNKTLDWTLDTWPASVFHVPVGPLVSVTSITYTDEDGDSDTVSSDDYIVDTAYGRIALKATASWPAVTLQRIAGVRIRYVAGYGSRSGVPDEFKQAVLLVTGDWYENRENMLVGVTSNRIAISVQDLLQLRRGFPIEHG